MICARCGHDVSSHQLSMFNLDDLCLACKHDETEAPGYPAAVRAEADALRGGDYNYAGVGLSPADVDFLRIRRRLRGAICGS